MFCLHLGYKLWSRIIDIVQFSDIVGQKHKKDLLDSWFIGNGLQQKPFFSLECLRPLKSVEAGGNHGISDDGTELKQD